MLATTISNFRPPPEPRLEHEVEMRYMPSVFDNIKHCQVFEDDENLKRFLELVEEFSAINIDNED